MKRKINTYFIVLALAAILLSVILSNVVSYQMLKEEVYADLEACAVALAGTDAFDNPDNVAYQQNSHVYRVTLIDSQGEVRFDSNTQVAADNMPNHRNRKEVKEALKEGEGKAVRHSATLQKDTYYYATRLSNGCVLRLAKEADGIINLLVSSIPLLLGSVVVLFGITMLFSHFLTKSILTPIEEMAKNMDEIEVNSIYREMRPFVNMVQSQHENIRKNANMRQEFSANVSHELKTPLTAISGYAEIIENRMASQEDTVRFAGEIHRNAGRLLRLINDTIRLSELDLSEGDDIFEEVPKEEFDLYGVAKECVDTLQVKAEKLRVNLRLVGETSLIRFDREMAHELLYNLCDNALRYNVENGRVLVIVGKYSENNIYLEVKDTGIGISKQHQERVFERFYRVDKSRSKETGGTGLGLAIVKHIVAKNRATLQMESEEGKGTMIRVIFPEECSVKEEE